MTKKITKNRESILDQMIMAVKLLNITEETMAEIVTTGIVQDVLDGYPDILAALGPSNIGFVCEVTSEVSKNLKKISDYCESMPSELYGFKTRLNSALLKKSGFRADISVSIYPNAERYSAGNIKHTIEMSLDFKFI